MHLNFKRLGLLGAHVARTLARVAALTPARADVLTLLREQPRIQREIAAILCVSEGVVSRLVTALEQAGLVQRTIPPRDRRMREVSLMDLGRERLAMMTNEYVGLDPLGSESVQCSGELFWSVHWDLVLTSLGLDRLSVIRDSPTPPYWHMQRVARQGVYRSIRTTLSQVPFIHEMGESQPSWAAASFATT